MAFPEYNSSFRDLVQKYYIEPTTLEELKNASTNLSNTDDIMSTWNEFKTSIASLEKNADQIAKIFCETFFAEAKQICRGRLKDAEESHITLDIYFKTDFQFLQENTGRELLTRMIKNIGKELKPLNNILGYDYHVDNNTLKIKIFYE